jgi:hypothetical protein
LYAPVDDINTLSNNLRDDDETMRILAPFIILISLFAAHFAAINVVAQESDAPFIYYFSRNDHAIIIERADGTDRYLIGEQVNKEIVLDIQWSPSGEWLAWITTDYQSYDYFDPYAAEIWVARYDGTDLFQVTFDNLLPSLLEWSPTEDWLLVQFDSGSMNAPITSHIIDVATQTTLTSVDIPISLPRWLADGHHIVFSDTHYDSTSRSYLTNTIVTASVEGEIHQNDVTDLDFWWTPDDRILYQDIDRQTLVIEDLRSDTRIQLPLLIDIPIVELRWNHSGEKAIVVSDSMRHDDQIQYSTYLLSLRDNVINPISLLSFAAPATYTNSVPLFFQAIWSPDGSAALIYVSPYFPANVQDETSWFLAAYLLVTSSQQYNLLTEHATYPDWQDLHDPEYGWPLSMQDNWTLWTPDSQRALFATTDGELLWVDSPSGNIEAVGVPINTDQFNTYMPTHSYGGRWSADGNVGAIMWKNTVWHYDHTTRELSPTPIRQLGIGSVSADGDYIAVTAFGSGDSVTNIDRYFPLDPKCVLTLDTQICTPLGQWHEATVNSIGDGEMVWHPTEPWVIFIEDLGGRFPHYAYSISDGTGSFYREIMEARWLNDGVFWLPDNVPIND